jgi:hypothetical protein
MNKKSDKDGMKKIGVWILTKQRDKLEKQQRKHGTPISESVRRALDLYFSKLR